MVADEFKLNEPNVTITGINVSIKKKVYSVDKTSAKEYTIKKSYIYCLCIILIIKIPVQKYTICLIN